MDAITTPQPQPEGDRPSGALVTPDTSGIPEYQLVLSDPTGIEAEAIRALRTRIVSQHLREGRRALAICAASAGTGCSFVAVNLATALAQIGIRTALVDANLREPAIGEAFGLTADKPGLADYLISGEVSLDAILHRTGMENLSVVPAGHVEHSPQELLSSEQFRELATQLLREFDITIFDTTASNSCADGQRVANVAGYALIVARRDASYMRDVTTLTRTLRSDRTNVVGCVLNGY
ncbi:CpsD/CapB family tyrosine-protein kinase [Sphingomonas pokkalii]|uniref:non-specific protein-tyrosine kinase n=1 Tax=Sphingomonas pokkalii TaxID=2175090 RepID=A0A2U0SDU0_9SPHN|nr:CpsD/CapB family tyrosine-protein kinase [Sphingomonas pokkalii]PVX29543.1 protein tyrosine kinase [Sphingomonas pokkalii]